MQKSGHVDDDVQISSRVVTSESCWNGIEKKMPEISTEVN